MSRPKTQPRGPSCWLLSPGQQCGDCGKAASPNGDAIRHPIEACVQYLRERLSGLERKVTGSVQEGAGAPGNKFTTVWRDYRS